VSAARPHRSSRVALGAVILGALAGCASVAPTQLSTDRLGFNLAVSDSMKEQALLNLVRLRYADMPVFLEVASVISSRSLEGKIDASAPAVVGAGSLAETMSIGGSATVGNRPTVTFTPVTGERFTRSMLTPIPPAAVFGLIQTGWPADGILRATVHSINDVGQALGGGAMQRTEDPDFEPMLASLTRAQSSGLLGIQVNRGQDGGGTLLVFRRRAAAQTLGDDSLMVRRTLGLDPNASQYTLVYGVQPRNDKDIAVLTRSMLEVMIFLAGGVEAAAADVESGAAPQRGNTSKAMIAVRSGPELPEVTPYVSTHYRGSWFWIDDTDVPSRRVFTFLMLLLSLTETGGGGQAPLITLPTG